MAKGDDILPGRMSALDGTYSAKYDWCITTPATAAVETVADAIGRDPADIGQLYSDFDPEALNNLILTAQSTTGGSGTVVSFAVETLRVTIHGSGNVDVEERI